VRQYASSASHTDPGCGTVLCNVLPALWTINAAERNIHDAINASNQVTSKEAAILHSHTRDHRNVRLGSTMGR